MIPTAALPHPLGQPCQPAMSFRVTTPKPVLGHKFSVAVSVAGTRASHHVSPDPCPGVISGCDDDEDRDHNNNYSGYKFDTRVEWLGHAFDPRRLLERMGWGIFGEEERIPGPVLRAHVFVFFVSLFFHVYEYIYKSLNGLFV